MGEWYQRLRSAVAVAVGLEALLVAAGAVYLTAGLFTDNATEFAAAVFQAVIAWMLAAALGWLAVGVLQRKAWARGPVITAQLLALPVAWSMIGSEKWYLGAVLMVAGVIGLTGVHPAVLGRAGGEDRTAPRDQHAAGGGPAASGSRSTPPR
jgi:hypothetical protein